jgi:hypothetical protein
MAVKLAAPINPRNPLRDIFINVTSVTPGEVPGMSLGFPFLVAIHTCFWFFYTHGLMATHALLMIRSDDPRFREVSLVKGSVVAVKTSRRFQTRRAVMVASLADGAFVVMKIGGKFRTALTRVHPFHKAQHNPSVRKFDLLILVHKGLDYNLFSDLFHRISPIYGLSRLKETFCNLFFSSLG